MLRKFFNGRYGMDNLILALLVLAAIFINMKYLWVLSVALLGYAVFRMLSKNLEQRNRELQAFNRVADKIKQFLMPAAITIAKGLISLNRRATGQMTRFKQRKQFVFIRCSNCKNVLRLPRNKGKLSVTCPVCKTEFIKKT